MSLLKFLTFLFQLFGAGRSPAAMLNLLAVRRGYRVHRDVAYAAGPRHAMDMYVPDGLGAPAPVVLFFYGGAFMAGRKSEYRMVGGALATAGIVVAVADYRILPQARFPDFLEDGAKAFAAVKRLAAQYGGDPERIFVAGHSAGAYIAVMLGADPRWLQKEGLDISSIRGVVGIASAYGAYGGAAASHPAFAGHAPSDYRTAGFVDGKRPPMLLASGGQDAAILMQAARDLAAKLREAGSEAEEIVYPKAGHMGIILSLSPRFQHIAPLRDDIARFVMAH